MQNQQNSNKIICCLLFHKEKRKDINPIGKLKTQISNVHWSNIYFLMKIATYSAAAKEVGKKRGKNEGCFSKLIEFNFYSYFWFCSAGAAFDYRVSNWIEILKILAIYFLLHFYWLKKTKKGNYNIIRFIRCTLRMKK